MRIRLTGLWRHPSFVLLWTGQTVSQLGSQVTLVALPLTAILAFRASPMQVGLLLAAGAAPAAVFGLLAGVWVDRVRRRALLIGCQLVLAVLTLSVPVAGWLGVLRLEHLFVLQGVGGALAVLSNTASQAHLPGLVQTVHLVEANAKLETSRSVTRIIGPSVAGTLVQLVGGPTAILVDALSFAFSAACLFRIRVPEAPPAARARRGLWAEIQEGLHLVLGHRLIRPIVVALALYNAFAAAFTAIEVLFMIRDLGLNPALVGIVLAGGGVGGVVGGVCAEQASRRFGIGRAIVVGAILLSVAHVAAPLAIGGPLVTAPLLFGASMLANFGLVIYSVNRASLIQQLVPAHAMGRVAATQQVVIIATVPIGAVVGGMLGEALGLRPTLGLAAAGTIVATLTLLLSPLSTAAAPPTIAPAEEHSDDHPPRVSGARLWRMHTLPAMRLRKRARP